MVKRGYVKRLDNYGCLQYLQESNEKNAIFTVLAASIILFTSCSSDNLSAPSSSSGITPSSNISGFVEPDPETFVALMPALREYFYYRKRAVITGKIEELWSHFPELKKNVDFEKGINSEELIVTNYQRLEPFDGNIFPEHYERFKVKFTNEQQVEVFVHGIELYTWLDESNKFDDSGGEFKVVLYLHMKDGHWVVYKTDEVTLMEWQQFSP